ncbi:MAG: radical SAM family heme chaperone HemW [Verrucomicrobia bacterium]|nr:radical SAM family heme chaperone HemW [Verrucomicrobiota bacterium]MBT7064819.1 radical SAM family heme chaperone HemW [Verrucomicrobiota bacterium]MBT7701211.1 radical SAM family heme chaperone HemW [Verrucomicrobiota bacterium]
MDRRPQHLYMHVPFCSGKCSYCAFYSEPYGSARAERYLDALERELAPWTDVAAGGCATLYIGGGTPSLLSGAQWSRLFGILAPVTAGGVGEWTVEANPGTLSAERLTALAAAGVNRISLGVQALDDAVLSALQRRHRVADVAPSVALVREAGIANVGLDLIAGLPGVEDAHWRDTLAQAIALMPDHVSVYALGVEPGTRLAQQAACGAVRLPADSAVMRALDIAASVLADAGLESYEISNYARAGRQSLHNLACWRGGDYLGLGPAAASRVGRERWTNAPDLAAYCAALEAGAPPPREHEPVDAETDLLERLLFRFRLAEGVPVADCCAEAGPVGEALWLRWQPELERLQNEGVLIAADRRWFTTVRGREVLDSILERLMP